MQVSQVTRFAYPRLTAALAPKNETLQHYLQRKGIADPKIRSAQYHHAQQAKRSAGRYRYPEPEAFQHRLLIEAQGPLLTTNEDGEFSSRGLTDWYVGEFCRLNHLKGN